MLKTPGQSALSHSVLRASALSFGVMCHGGKSVLCGTYPKQNVELDDMTPVAYVECNAFGCVDQASAGGLTPHGLSVVTSNAAAS